MEDFKEKNPNKSSAVRYVEDKIRFAKSGKTGNRSGLKRFAER